MELSEKIMGSIIMAIIFMGQLSNPVAQEYHDIDFQIEMYPWEEVDELLPKFSKFTVLDIETGKKFRVQRRAGNRHADVQPLTYEDTKIMKEIYDGKWSWRRRSIIVIHENQWIAASMHGMPHGAGSLRNNFPGHFCVYFYGSKTHRTNNEDLSHKLMILKAAGKLQSYLSKADPQDLIYAYVAAIKQKDSYILADLSHQNINWEKELTNIENIKLLQIDNVSKDSFQRLGLEIPVNIEWINQSSKRKKFSGNIYLFRFSPFDTWKIDSIQFLKDFNFND